MLDCGWDRNGSGGERVRWGRLLDGTGGVWLTTVACTLLEMHRSCIEAVVARGCRDAQCNRRTTESILFVFNPPLCDMASSTARRLPHAFAAIWWKPNAAGYLVQRPPPTTISVVVCSPVVTVRPVCFVVTRAKQKSAAGRNATEMRQGEHLAAERYWCDRGMRPGDEPAMPREPQVIEKLIGFQTSVPEADPAYGHVVLQCQRHQQGRIHGHFGRPGYLTGSSGPPSRKWWHVAVSGRDNFDTDSLAR